MIAQMSDVNTISSQNRDTSMDVLRGICILFMIMGHIGFGSVFSKYIHAFHVPIFFVISGYFYKEGKLAQRIKIRFRSLIVPYIVFGIFHLIVYWAIEGITFKEVVFGSDSMLFHLLVMNSLPLPIAGALWFLVALFFCDLLFLLIDSVIKSEALRHAIFTLLTFLGMFWTKLFFFRPPECIDIVLANMLVYDFGWYIRQHKRNNTVCRLLNFRPIEILALFMISAALIMVSLTINVKQGQFGNGIMYIINVMLSFITYLNLSKWLLKINLAGGKINGFLCYVGRNSMIYLCFNQLMIKLFNLAISACGLSFNNDLEKAGINIINLLVTTVLLTCLSAFFQRNKVLKGILGKND